jgi:hypothetical protein
LEARLGRVEQEVEIKMEEFREETLHIVFGQVREEINAVRDQVDQFCKDRVFEEEKEEQKVNILMENIGLEQVEGIIKYLFLEENEESLPEASFSSLKDSKKSRYAHIHLNV